MFHSLHLLVTPPRKAHEMSDSPGKLQDESPVRGCEAWFNCRGSPTPRARCASGVHCRRMSESLELAALSPLDVDKHGVRNTEPSTMRAILNPVPNAELHTFDPLLVNPWPERPSDAELVGGYSDRQVALAPGTAVRNQQQYHTVSTYLGTADQTSNSMKNSLSAYTIESMRRRRLEEHLQESRSFRSQYITGVEAHSRAYRMRQLHMVHGLTHNTLPMRTSTVVDTTHVIRSHHSALS